MIYKELTQNDIVQALLTDVYAAWSYSEAQALANYYLAHFGGQEWELDVTAIRCDFSSYESALEALKQHCLLDDDDEVDEADALERLRSETTVLETKEGILILNF